MGKPPRVNSSNDRSKLLDKKSTESTTPMKTPKKSTTPSRVDSYEDIALHADAFEVATTPDYVCDMYVDRQEDHPIRRYHSICTHLAPRADSKMPVGVKYRGILVNGPRDIPQFFPYNKEPKHASGTSLFAFRDNGFLVKNGDGNAMFYPDSEYEFDDKGFPIALKDDQKIYYEPVILKVYDRWRKKWQTPLIILWIILGIIGLFILLGLIYAAYAIGTSLSSTSSSSSNTDFGTETVTELNNLTNPSNNMSSMSTTTGITRVYPSMTAVQRIPITDLMKPTFEIVSSSMQLAFQMIHPRVVYGSSVVNYVLRVTNLTNVIQLRGVVQKFGSILLRDTGDNIMQEIKNISQDPASQLLTLILKRPIDKITVTLQIPYTPSQGELDRISFPCEPKTCTVVDSRKLCFLVPHFDYSTKQKWNIQVDHPIGVTVLTSSKVNSNASSAGVTIFQETAPLLLSELSFMILENFAKKSSRKKRVDSYVTSGTKEGELTVLVDNLERALSSTSTPISPTTDVFYLVVIPGMESYRFSGRNMALVGVELLRCNNENQLIFVWEWIFRAIIYKKVTSSEKITTWMYDQSAVFLSRHVQSYRKDVWQQHEYASALAIEGNGLQETGHLSVTYEDEYRYYEREQHISKISTLMNMLTSIDISDDVLANLDSIQDTTISSQFVFLKSQIVLSDGQSVNVDSFLRSYIDSPAIPRLQFTRLDSSNIVVQRPTGGQYDRCDIHLMLVGEANKEHKYLKAGVEKIQVPSTSPLLLSGASPSSAYGYTMEQTEFDKLLLPNAMDSYDDKPSIKLLAVNAVRTAFEGKLSYASLQTFIKLIIPREVISVDEAVDMWMWTVVQSRSVDVSKLVEKIVGSMLNTTKDAAGIEQSAAYVVDRFKNAVKEAPLVQIEHMKEMVKMCGGNCFAAIESNHRREVDCVNGTTEDCTFDSHVLEMYVCSKVILEPNSYNMYITMSDACTGKPCRLPIIRGLLCTRDLNKLEKWLNETLTLTNIDDIVNRQLVQLTFHGLASNDLSKPLLLPYLLDNWHLIHNKYSKYPALLGAIVDTMTSTITTDEQLLQYQHFVSFYGEQLIMFREFKEQISKAEATVNWNNNLSADFSRVFD